MTSPRRRPEASVRPARRRAAWTISAVWLLGPVAIGALVVALVRWPASTADPTPRKTPEQNVLLVTIDTLRADALGAYGGPAATPNLDRLASEGTRYEFAHAHAVVTLPSHASILTGLYPFQHGLRDNSGYRLGPEPATMAGMLRAAGYDTAAFIAAFPLDSQFGLDRGFDHYDDRLGEAEGPTDFTIAERRGEEVVAAALEWIGTRRRRWFAWVHLFDPHAAYAPPPPFDRRYAESPYHGEVAYADQVLGPLLSASRGDRTLIIVTADHGEGLGDHGELTHGVFAYEPTLRVPLIIAQTGATPAPPATTVAPSDGPAGGRVSSRPVRHIDLLPTVLDALGLPVPPDLPGVSLLGPPLRSADAPPIAYFEAMSASLNRGWAPLRGVLVGREKLIDLPLPEIYDLAVDPGEASNLAEKPERHRRLAARLEQLDAAGPGPRRAEDAASLRRLRSLGYTSSAAAPSTHYTAADDPKNLAALDRAIHEGIALFQAGRLGEAISTYERLVAERPDMALAYRHLGFLHWMAGESDAAVDTLTRALDVGAGTDSIRTQLGIYLAEAGAPLDAIARLEPLAAVPGADPDTLNALGIAYARAERTDEALDLFRQLLAADPDNAMAHENTGTIHLQLGNAEAAERAFERALAVAPRSSRALTGLGAARLHRGDQAGAIESWTRAVELDPDDFDALFNLGTELVNAGRLRAARPYLERFVASAPPGRYGDDIRRLAALLGR